MRICLYTGSALPKLGGQEAVVDALARHFTRLGHRAVVLAPRPRRPLRPHDGELPYPVARHPRFYSTRHFVAWYRRWLLSLDQRERFDVVHCHDVYPTGYIASLCKPTLAAPTVITSHGGDIKSGNIRITKPGMRPRYVAAIQSADALVSIGRFTEDAFRSLVPNPRRLEHIPNGIDLEPFAVPAPRPSSLDVSIQPSRYILFLGRLKHRKGVDLLLDALARVAVGDVNQTQLVIAGSGDEEPSILARIDQLGLRSRVRLVGRVDGSDKMYLLQNAIATVMPSRVWEAFPLVLIESFAAGRPVVGTAVPGIVDLIDHQKTGIVVQPDSADSLADAIRLVLSHPDQAAAMGRKAAAFAQGYSWHSIAKRHLALFDALQSSAPATHR